MTGAVYLDHNATTPCDPEVIDAMMPYFANEYGNPSSQHSMGRVAATAVSKSRGLVATALGCSSEQIIFTGGATESNNFVLLGLSQDVPRKRKRIVTSTIEHRSILQPCARLCSQGFEIIHIPASQNGLIDVEGATRAITEATLLVTIQGANNEIGTLQPVLEIANIAHTKGVLVHCDATQMLGKVRFSLHTLGVDIASFSAHKAYGPKGVGCIVLASQEARQRFSPVFRGGHQERGLRPGTLNVPGIVGFGVACALIQNTLDAESKRISTLRDDFERKLLKQNPGVQINCAASLRLPGTSSVTLPNVPADMLIANIPQICISNGSACTSGSPAPSHVLRAIGLTKERAECTFRVSFGRYNVPGDVDVAVAEIVCAAERLDVSLAGDSCDCTLEESTLECSGLS